MQGDHPESEAPGEAGSDGARTDYGQGFSWNEDDAGSLEDVVEAAFDYRGDVTIFPRDGEALVGYLANRSIAGQDPRRHISFVPIGQQPCTTWFRFRC